MKGAHARERAQECTLDQGWARNSGREVSGCKAFLYYFYVLDGGRMKAMFPKHGEGTTE